ncbi:GAF domain-containing hybrid sensor histidine kinase/response regulator [Planktothrix mougeotii]|uniref:histidine kinase n=1 Tax=Planktothrix mougeotii LEGE 06226 TaxID=1828728 RepID=A0ABR9UAA8_9CYAN|nr:GAF domain-containing hybrid sensor histidine kinase/response regulator [Planktothrix mougeotii]MBE9143395.1 GAF domain-containing protein [Planktothrix mougeotii LEGE 06226]
MSEPEPISSNQEAEAALIQELETLRKRVLQLEKAKSTEPYQVAQQKALFAVISKIRESLDLDSIFKSTAIEVRQLLNADRVGMYRFDPDSQYQWGEFVSEDVLPNFRSALSAKIKDHCFGEHYINYYFYGKIWAADDIYTLPLPRCYAQMLSQFQIRANLVSPLLKGENLWGLLCIHQCSGPREWKESEMEFVRQIATHLGVALQHAEFVKKLQMQSEYLTQAVNQAVEREKAVAAIINKIRQSLQLDTIFTTTTQEVRQLLKADRVVIYRFNADWSGEFLVESKAEGWKSLIEEQKYDPQFGANISQCSLKYLATPDVTDSYLQETQGGDFTRGEVFRVCDNIYKANFSTCYIQALERYEAQAYAIIAIYQGKQLWGLLAVYQNQSARHWETSEIKFLVQIGGQLGVAIQQAELLAQTEKQKRDLETILADELRRQAESLVEDAERERALAQVIDKIRRTLDINTIFQTATSELRQLLNADRVAVFQFEPNSYWNYGKFVSENVLFPFCSVLETEIEDHCFGARFAQNYPLGHVLVLPDIYQGGLTDCYVQLLAQFQIKANLVVALLKGDELWGLLCIHQCSTPRQWQKKEIEFVRKIAVQLGVALQQAELLTQAQKRSEEQAKVAEQERALARVIDRIRQTLDIDTIFSATTQEVRQILQCDRVVVYRFISDRRGEFIFESKLSCGIPLEQAEHKNLWLETHFKYPKIDQYQNHQPLIIDDIFNAPLSPSTLKVLQQFQIRAYILVPVFVGEILWGLLGAYQHTSSRHWQPREVSLLTQVANQLGVAIQQAKLLAQLKEAKDTADAANHAKSEFLANMSHELRTPLNAILGFTQILAKHSGLSSVQQEYLRIIERSGEHLLDLINDVLEMSKIEAGRLTLNETSFDLYRLLNNLQEMLELKAEMKGLNLIFERDQNVPQYIKTDESKLRQVLINLLGNAIKFTEVGCVILRVKQDTIFPKSITTEAQNSEPIDVLPEPIKITFEVEDTGPGIASEEIDLLFEAFGQTETGRKSKEGTGLGLPISQQFVQMMGGNIIVNSLLGTGTWVKFFIKTGLADCCDIQPQLSKKSVVGLVPGQPTYRILIVEDAVENRQVLVELLSTTGFEVREALNGQEAVELSLSWQPHLIWMDMRMPVMDGIEATRRIRANSPSENSPIIIALTANAFKEERAQVLQAGCDDFVSKPFQDHIIFEKMAEYLGLEYEYADSQTSTHLNSNLERISTPGDLSLDCLVLMPPAWIQQFHEAVLCTQEKRVFELIQEIPESYSALALTLKKLADEFQFDQILAVTETLILG